MKHKFIKLFFLLWIAVTVFAQTGQTGIGKLIIEADGLPKKPELSVQKQHSVYDYANLLVSSERKLLEERISKYYDSTSTQILIATVNKINDDISLYATEWAHKWGIGQKDKGNGIFILISKDDHKVTIRTGYGVEHLLTDALCRRIIERNMIPYFKKGYFYAGLDKALTSIQKILKGEFVNDLEEDQDAVPFWVFLIIIIIFIIIISSMSNRNNQGGGWTSSGGGPIIFSSGGRSTWGNGSSWGSGGSFGGGFSGGFGGGGFGGGGATGGW